MVDVSVIIPMCNSEPWIVACLQSVLSQDCLSETVIEICVFDDHSTDNSVSIARSLIPAAAKLNIELIIIESKFQTSQSCAYARNRAIERSQGLYLCFLDSDDVCEKDRIRLSLAAAKNSPELSIIGCRFRRDPADSTVRYTNWANNLTPDQLHQQIYTANGLTLILPTWFMHRSVNDLVGGFCEKDKSLAFPEDLDYFYRALDKRVKLIRLDQSLVVYRYHLGSVTLTTRSAEVLWTFRFIRFQSKILNNWPEFSIWNAGKAGKHFYKSLSPDNQLKVLAVGDVDRRKLHHAKYEEWDEKTRSITRSIEIIPFEQLVPPVVICVKLDMTDGEFENNLRSMNWIEAKDYYIFN